MTHRIVAASKTAVAASTQQIQVKQQACVEAVEVCSHQHDDGLPRYPLGHSLTGILDRGVPSRKAPETLCGRYWSLVHQFSLPRNIADPEAQEPRGDVMVRLLQHSLFTPADPFTDSGRVACRPEAVRVFDRRGPDDVAFRP